MAQNKVALFTGNYHHVRDGVSLTLNRLVAFLLENGVDVLVFGPTIDDPPMEHSGVMVAVPSVKAPGRPEYRITTGFPDDAREKLEDFDPDIVHIATPDILGYKALKWARKNSVPVVSSFHTNFTSYLKYYKLGLMEPLGWKYLRWFYGQCEHVYVPTESMAQELRDQQIDTNLKIWARGIDVEKFNPSYRNPSWRKKVGFSQDDIVVTFVSRLVWEKNLELFADVVQDVQKTEPKLKALVVGEGPAMTGLKHMMPNAAYLGFLKGEELSSAYANSDIFFFPSDTETFGNVTLEAMASGLPCLVADAVGSKSLVAQNKNGFLGDVNDPETFKKYLKKLVDDSDLRQQMSAESLTRAEDYSWESINNNLLGYYQEILQGITTS